MPKKSSLSEYKEKRDFRKTPEPAAGSRRIGKKNLYVIQKHAARHLHYDFRLEVNGVLKSWAIPKGPSMDPSEKRLAVQTEDHPLDYADFEGIIPEGQYGAGTVLVWDIGSYINLKEKDGGKIPMAKCIENGHTTIWLEGRKLRGGYSLMRFRRDKKDQWLLVKMNDSEADANRNPVHSEPHSVLTGRTIEEITDGEDTA